MTRQVAIGCPPIEVHLRRSARARRYSLRISSVDGKVSLTLPQRASEIAAVEFARRQEGWLRSALDKRPDTVFPAFGGTVPYLGCDTAILPGASRTVQAAANGLLVPGPETTVGAKLKGFFRVQAREKLDAASRTYAAQLQCNIGRINLRDTRSRWGSCTANGNLMYSWRLIMAPPAVLDYVAAHEVSHLVEMNHSPAFWALVANLMPDFNTHRQWLKLYGSALHRVRFQQP